MLRTTILTILAAGSVMAGPLGYAVNFSGQFGTIDLGTGAFTLVGSGLPNTPDGIGGAPGGPFYTVDGVSGHLLRIGANGAVSDVGDTGGKAESVLCRPPFSFIVYNATQYDGPAFDADLNRMLGR